MRLASSASKISRASSPRPIRASASIRQNEQTLKAVSGRPKSSGASYRRMKGPSQSARLEGGDGLDEARIGRLDEAHLGHQQNARVEVPAAEALDEGLARLAPGLLEDLRRGRSSARSRQNGTRSGAPTTAAILARRSQAAQHISDEEVWTRARVRSSHMPASGWSCIAQACSPTASSSRKSRRSATARAAAGRRTPARHPGRCCRRRRAAHARTPGCRRAPVPCRDIRRARARAARSRFCSSPMP